MSRSSTKTRTLGALSAAILFSAMTATEAANITATIGAQPGSGATYVFVGADDGNVWLNTNSGGTFHWQNLAPLSVAFGVGATAPGGNPAAYAVGSDGNLYIIHQIGSSWSTQSIGTPPGVALQTPVGVISNTSNQPFVFLFGSDGNLWLAHNAGSWTWRNLGTPPGVGLKEAAGAVNIPGSYPQIFVVGTDDNVWVAQWNGSSYPWMKVGNGVGNCYSPMFAWQTAGLPYVYTHGGVICQAVQDGGGGPWTWSYPGCGEGGVILFAVGLALNNDLLDFVETDPIDFTQKKYVESYNCQPKYTKVGNNMVGTIYEPKTPVGSVVIGNVSYGFWIAESGHLVVVTAAVGNLGWFTGVDLGTPP